MDAQEIAELKEQEWICIGCMGSRHACTLNRLALSLACPSTRAPSLTPTRTLPSGSRLYEMNDAYRVCALGATCKESLVYNTCREAVDQELAKVIKIAKVLDPAKAPHFEKFRADVEEALKAPDHMYAACAATPPSCASTTDFDAKIQHLLSLKDVLHELQPALQLQPPGHIKNYTDYAMEMRAAAGQDAYGGKTQSLADTTRLKVNC